MNDQVIKLNKDIENHFPHIFKIEEDYTTTFEGISRMVMLDRYSLKDIAQVTLGKGDLVVTIVKDDPTFPVRGIGEVLEVNDYDVIIKLEEEYKGTLVGEELETGIITRHKSVVDKPMEIYFEQIAKRVGYALADKEEFEDIFFQELKELNIVPAGRVLHGAGSDSNVTWFNCYVQPMIKDSREGISDHRKEVMEIMSRGGGVGTNGSTLRPRGTIAKSVGGKSSGSISWLNDLANLTHLVEQGGSRRGAQMIMMADWHPDIVEFIVSKMQNPKVLQWLVKNSKDAKVREEAENKLKFKPLSIEETLMYEAILHSDASETIKSSARDVLFEGGKYEVQNPDFLTGANISVAITKEFMEAVENNDDYELRYPHLDVLTKEQKDFYDKEWHNIGDVREWEAKGYPVKTYYTIKAKDLWDLISFAATYSAEPGLFFIDNANDDTNATAYGQKVVSTNPCKQ